MNSEAIAELVDQEMTAQPDAGGNDIALLIDEDYYTRLHYKSVVCKIL